MDKYCQLGEYRMHGNRKIKGVIGATMHLIKKFGKRIVIDCGIGFDKGSLDNKEFQINYVPDGNWLIGKHLDLIIITHKHLDHCGALVRLAWHHSEALIFMSAKTFEGVCIAIEDSLKIWRNNAKDAHRKDLPVPEPIFTAEMAEAFYNNPNLKVFEAPYWLDPQEDLRGQWPEWEIGFYDSGHDVGAVSIFMVFPNGKPFYLTGDAAGHDQENTKGVIIPPYDFLGDFFDRPGLIMVTEATGGAKKIEKSVAQLDKDLSDLLKQVDARGGTALFPAFAATKAGNIAVKLNKLGYSVVVDGLAREHIRIEVPDVNQRIESGMIKLIEGKNRNLAWQLRAEYAAGVNGFVPIIAPSATLDQGFAASAYAPVILPGDKNAVVFTGHIFNRSVAERLINVQRGRTIRFNRFVNNRLEPVHINVTCEVNHFDFSSHDNQNGLVERVRLARPEKIFVHHCPGVDSFLSFAKKIRELPQHSEIYWALNSYGVNC